MTVYDKKLKELSIILQQDNIFKVKAAIRSLRKSPYFEGAIGLLASLYDRSHDQSLKKIIADFMNDLKGNSVCSEVVTEINKKRKPETITMLVSSCWQSGLDYSDYCKDFVGYSVCRLFYCHRMLHRPEASVESLNRSQKNEVIKLLKKAGFLPTIRSILWSMSFYSSSDRSIPKSCRNISLMGREILHELCPLKNSWLGVICIV